MVRVPIKTTLYRKEPESDEYIVNFAPELINFILSGKKIKTYRFGKEKDYLKIGDTVSIRNTETRKIIGKAFITNKVYSTFAKLPYHIPGHETYSDKEHQRKVFSGYYAFLGRKIRDDDPFIIFEFKLLNKE